MPTVPLDLGYIFMVSPDKSIEELGDKGAEILILGPIDLITVHLTYCLGRPTSFRLRPDDPDKGFNRAELARSISTMYQRVYQVEEQTSTIAPSGMGPLVLNRGFTNGKYCISMHDLEDLILHTGDYDEEKRTMELGIDS